MGKQWTDEEVRAEIAAAVKIVREDRERAEYTRLHATYGASSGDNGNNQPNNGPPAPPKKEEEGEGESIVAKRSIWWGDSLNE
jgi:hypothetical protein